jgi:ABC-type transport system substrate-binding protein
MKRGAFLTVLGAVALPSPTRTFRPFRVGVDTLGTTLDPYAVPAPEIDDYAWIYGDGLTTGEAVPAPMLADVPETRDGGLTMRYRLRHILWHDGAVLHARHIAEAVERLHRAGTPGAQTSPWLTFEPYSLIRDIAPHASDTIDIRLHRPHSSFARTFFSPYAHPALPLLRHDSDSRPIGTGPFRLQRADAERWSFSAWKGSPRGVPASRALEVRFRPSRDEMANEIAAGQIDLAIPLAREEPASDAYRIVSRDASTVVMLFNCEGAFHTAALRVAVLRALDVDILQRTIDPRAKLRLSGILPAGTADDVAFRFPPHDVARARAELSGVRAPVTMIYPLGTVRYQTLALQVRQMLQAAGVDVQPVPRSQLGYFAPDGAFRTGRFDIAVYGFAYGDHPDLAPDWSCANVVPAGANYARFCDPSFDAALVRGREREALRTLLDDAAVVPLARNPQRFGVGARVTGFEVPPRFVPPSITAHRWAVPGETS